MCRSSSAPSCSVWGCRNPRCRCARASSTPPSMRSSGPGPAMCWRCQSMRRAPAPRCSGYWRSAESEVDLGGGAARRGAAPGPADGPHLAGLCAAAEESVAAIGLEAGNAHSGRHPETLQDLTRVRIDPPQFALLAFPGAVPEFAVDPGDPGNEAVGLDRAQNRPGFRIDLTDLPVPILSHPQRPFGPREPRIAARSGRRDRGEHLAGLRIDLLDAAVRNLKQVPAVEGRARMRRDLDRAQQLPALRIECHQLVARRNPGVLPVKGHATHLVAPRKGTVLTDDFGFGFSHALILADRE